MVEMHEAYVDNDDFITALKRERDEIAYQSRMNYAIKVNSEKAAKLAAEQAMLEVAKGLKEKNVDIETIISVTHLTKEEISEI